MIEILPTLTFLIGLWIGKKLSEKPVKDEKIVVSSVDVPEFKMPAYSPTLDKHRAIEGKDFTYFKDAPNKKRPTH